MELGFKNTVSVPFGGTDTANGILAHCSCTLSTPLPVPIAKMPTIFENICFSLRLFLQQCAYHRSCNFACLYGCETWSVTLREERWLRVFENRVLRKIFGLKRDYVKGNRRNCLRRLYCDKILPV